MSLAPFTSHTSILSLPTEIVASILEAFVIEATGNEFSVFQIAGGLPPQFVLMAVCKRWKEICLSHLQLWTRICIDLLPASPTAGTDASIWNRFALVCQDALSRGASLPLDLKLFRWHLGTDAFQSLSETCYDGQIFDSTTFSFKIMRSSIEQSLRWKSFTMEAHHMVQEIGTMADIPWCDLVNVANRVPRLKTLCLGDFWRVHPSYAGENWRNYMDTFLDAPSLDAVSIPASSTPLNLPWAQLTVIDIDTFASIVHQRLAEYFDVVMTHTTAHTVTWSGNLSFATGDGGIAPTPSVIENHHIVQLRLPPLSLPSMLLPNLTTLEFLISDEEDEDIDSVAQIVLLLKDSNCRLLDLTINQWSAHYEGSIISFDPLLPHLESLQSLTWNASLVDEEIAIDLLAGLRSILVANDPVELPNLTTLEINLLQSDEEGEINVYCHFDTLQAQDVWDIVQARMLVSPVVKLEKFHIDVRATEEDEEPQIWASTQEFDECEEGRNIKASGVDFELRLSVETTV